MDDKLSVSRQKIDLIDEKILKLLRERVKLAQEIGHLKGKGNQIFSPNRERKILDRMKAKCGDILPEASCHAIWREIISACRNAQCKIQVAYLGPKASFTNIASVNTFGSSAEFIECRTIREVFNEVLHERVKYGVVPVENSIEGAVNYTIDMFLELDTKISAEVYLKISHHLLGLKKQDFASIKKVYSHPQVFAQCREWIENNLPHAELVETTSTAQAACTVVSSGKGVCIASELAAREYSLEVLANNIQDVADNVTRFFVLGGKPLKKTGQDKTALLVFLRDRVGGLHDMLIPFKNNAINLTMIESRPSKRKSWEYCFFMEFAGHVEEPRVKKALEELSALPTFVKILGSFHSF